MKGITEFDFEEERIKQQIRKLDAKRILLQLPEGLKKEGPRLARIVEEAGALPIISADPCYGACDLAIVDAEKLRIDLIIHFGHSRLVKHENIQTIYVEARATISVEDSVQKSVPLLRGYNRIGLTTTVQHIQTLDEAREILVRAGKTVVIGDAGRLSYSGQVIGCNYSNAKSVAKDVDAFLFIGGGRFHALGVALSSGKPTVIADPYENNSISIDLEAKKILKQQWASIQEAKRANTFGILVGLKLQQTRLRTALKIKKMAEKSGKTAFIFAIREILPEALIQFPSVDAYVNTACPRISIDAPSKFLKPVLTVNEFMVVLGESSWENIIQKGLFED